MYCTPQVEHGITEMVSGVDLVAWMFQLQGAPGDELPADLASYQPAMVGQAIEVRLVGCVGGVGWGGQSRAGGAVALQACGVGLPCAGRPTPPRAPAPPGAPELTCQPTTRHAATHLSAIHPPTLPCRCASAPKTPPTATAPAPASWGWPPGPSSQSAEWTHG